LVNDPSKCKVTATDISDFLWWSTSNLYKVASFFYKKEKAEHRFEFSFIFERDFC
jgi:hypothetical protein